jgi:hypothetical protein
MKAVLCCREPLTGSNCNKGSLDLSDPFQPTLKRTHLWNSRWRFSPYVAFMPAASATRAAAIDVKD